MGFVKATREQSKLRLNLNGPAGSGKTYTALAIATALGAKIALVDTERKSASKYARTAKYPHLFEFDSDTIADDYNPKRLIKCLDDMAAYDVGIVDSLTHFWNGPGGFLDLVDQEVKDMKARGNRQDSFAAWKTVTPLYNMLIQKLLGFPGHLICTARAKMDYEKQTDERGKTKVVKLGLAPELRDGWQYEFDVEGMLTEDNVLIIGKTRCPELKGKTFKEPGADVANILKRWLEDGVEAAPMPIPVPVASRPANDNMSAMQRCINEIGAADTLAALEAIGARIAKTPKDFQAAVDATYTSRELFLKGAA